MVRKGLPVLALLLSILLASCAFTGGLEVREAWARSALAGNNSAVYFVIDNNTRQNDALTGVTGDIAAAIEMHMSSIDSNGVAQMQPENAILVPSSATMELKPGGYHIMLMNLKNDLKPGDTFSLTLQFRVSGDQAIQVKVKDQ